MGDDSLDLRAPVASTMDLSFPVVDVQRIPGCGAEERLWPLSNLHTMLDHLEGILNYCRIKIPLGVVEAVNGNIKALLRRGFAATAI